MKNRINLATILLAFMFTSLLLTIPAATSAAGPYEYLILNQSEASAMGLETVKIIDNSANDNIDVQGEYRGTSIVDQGMLIGFTAAISRLSPTDDISFDTALANCTLCANPGWGNCRVWSWYNIKTVFERPCLSRFEDGYIDFGVNGIFRNRGSIGGTSVFSANGLKITITSAKLDYHMSQEVWDEVKRRHNEFANLIAHKIRTTYDPQTIALTLTPLNSTYAPGETAVISGSVADTFDSTPLVGASITIDVSGTLLSTTANTTGNFSVQFDIPNAVSSVGTYPITVTASSSGYPDVSEATYLTVEEVVLEVTVSTDKDAYAPGDTVVIQGQVTEGGTAVLGATVEITVVSEGTLSRTTDGSGGYRIEFQIPADAVPSTFSVLVTATTVTASNPATANTTFTVGQTLTVTITCDKNHYLIGDTVYCTIKVNGAPNTPIPYADLTIKKTHLTTGRTINLTGLSDATGENIWTFTWGKDAAGHPINEGKLKIEVTASKSGYTDDDDTITLSGCGDLVHSDIEDCLDCPEDCACGPTETCDPSSDYKNQATMCSPMVAYVFISNGLGWYHEWWSSDDIRGIRKKYRKLGYRVPASIHVSHFSEIAPYLSRPSTKALAYAGHGEEPGGLPTIGVAAARPGSGTIIMKDAIAAGSRQDGGFLFRCQSESYAAKWVESQDKLEEIAYNRKEHPDLDYVYNFSCYSLDDDSLMNYLVKKKGTYWGYPGKLPGSSGLIKRTK